MDKQAESEKRQWRGDNGKMKMQTMVAVKCEKSGNNKNTGK